VRTLDADRGLVELTVTRIRRVDVEPPLSIEGDVEVADPRHRCSAHLIATDVISGDDHTGLISIGTFVTPGMSGSLLSTMVQSSFPPHSAQYVRSAGRGRCAQLSGMHPSSIVFASGHPHRTHRFGSTHVHG